MSKVRAAFYVKRPGHLVDRLIRWRTSSNTSHVELVVDGLMYSSSPVDGGVRSKPFPANPDPNTWILVDLPDTVAVKILSFFQATKGSKYDWLAVAVGQLLAAKIKSRDKWFCSEWCASALGKHDSWRYSPGLLLDVLQDECALRDEVKHV